jgi:hypothetical protein
LRILENTNYSNKKEWNTPIQNVYDRRSPPVYLLIEKSI